MFYTSLQARYTWRPEDTARAHAAFFEAAPKLYKGMMKRLRDRALELLETGDLTQCIDGGRPMWITEAIWERLIRDHWATDRFRELSEKNRQNRLTIKDGEVTRHVGGSISTEINEARLVCVIFLYLFYKILYKVLKLWF